MSLSAPIFVSVVVCTRDRPADLARCLPTLLALEYPSFDITVVDQSDTEDTARLVTTAVESCSAWTLHSERDRQPRALHYLHTASRGLSHARNTGIRVSSGEVIAFTDDDCTVPPNWLAKGVEAFGGDPAAGMVFGALNAAPHDESREYVPTFAPRAYRVIDGPDLGGLPGAGANMLVRRELFDVVGLFDIWLGAGGRFRSAEDLLMAHRAIAAGYRIVQDPATEVIHWGARPLATGDAHRLRADGYYGAGAGFGWYARRGDRAARRALAGEIAHLSRLTASNLLSTGRPQGVRLLAWFLRGALDVTVRPPTST